ncbi:MAG TPA: MFS transporter [Longimicrobiales bacterium]|nr:MFS transporter [Longimicrobiales bacterium]
MTKLLQRVMNIEPDEVAPILMAALYFFFILTALMILRPAREALGMTSGLDTVRWLFMLTLVATLALNPVFGWLVSRYRRLVFIAAIYFFFAANLVGFYVLLVLTPAAVGELTGRVFYVWMSVFNLFVTMVFWALMADRFTLDQGKRLFGLIAVGGTAGAVFGSAIAWTLAERIGAPLLLILASGFLALAVGSAWLVTRLTVEVRQQGSAGATDASNRAVIGGSAWEGFKAVFRSRYLLGISSYVLILAVLVTFLYFTRLQMVAAIGEGVDEQTALFAQIDLITQVATLVLQAVVAGHLMKRVGVSVTLALLPITVALGYIGLAIVGTLTALIVFEAVFRAVQRAIMRPARETLFTVVSREDKYKSKAFVDTFIYRGGDAVGAQVEGGLVRTGMGLAAVAAVAVPLAIVWAALGIWLGREQQRQKNREQSHRELQHQST